MGNSQSIIKVNFEDIQFAYKHSDTYMLINTLPITEQNCLIKNTLNAANEENIINEHVKNGRSMSSIKIIIYGKNSTDDTTEKKYAQLVKLGFSNVYVYSGGLFEWLLLQDIYGSEEFPTTSKQTDHLKYKSAQKLHVFLLN